MASLNPQTNVNPTESFFLLATATNFNSPADFRNANTGSSANIIVGDETNNIQLQTATDTVINQITQSDAETAFFIGNTNYPSVQVVGGGLLSNGYIAVTDAPYSNMYFDITSGDNTNPTFLYNHASNVPGGVDSAITFTRNGFVTTTDILQVGSSPVASLNVGPLLGNRVAAGPNRFSFANGGTPTGGMYQVGGTIVIGQGADPGLTGAGVTVGANTVGFRKPIEAQSNGVSINAQGAIRSASSANNVGGLVQVQNGNYVVNLQATGDAFTPNGVGGSVTAFNAGTNTGAPLTLNTGVNSSIVGPSDGVMNIGANSSINLYTPPNAPTQINLTSSVINLNCAVSINLGATTAGANINLNAANSINLNAPQVLINGGLISLPSFFYQWNGVQQDIDGNATLGSGSFLGWDTTLYQTPGYGSRFISPDITAWVCPVAGVYFVTVNLICNLQNAAGGMSVDLLKVPAAGGLSRVGAQMRVAAYQPQSSSPTSNLPFFQTQPGTVCGTFYINLAVNDKLYMCGGTFDPGGFLYVQPQSTWSLQYVAAQ